MSSDSAHGFRHALGQPGALTFTSAGLLARLPVAMIALATVLLVSNVSGSYGYAGLLSALFAITAALVSIGTSRWADTVGQTLVLRALAVLHSGLIVGFTVSIVSEAAVAVQILLVVAAGATTPAIGSYVRARWVALPGEASIARAGFAWESILDEAIFTIGPLLTTYVAFTYGLATPLWIAAVCVAVGTLLLSAARRTAPPVVPTPGGSRSLTRVLRSPGLRPVVVSGLGLGVLFGALDVGVVAFTAEQGSGELAGIALACFAAASMVGGILYGIRQWPGSVLTHTQIAAAATAAVMLLVPFVPGNTTLAIAAAAAGFCIAPTLIGLFTLTRGLVPARNVTEGLTWTNSGLATGFALGSAVAGILVDAYGTGLGLGTGLAGALCAATAIQLRAATIRENVHSPPPGPPAPAWNDDPIAGPHPDG